MVQYDVPTAAYGLLRFREAKAYIERKEPIVVKADGGLGKGVVVAETIEQATPAAHEDGTGPSNLVITGARVVIEEFMTREKGFSLFALLMGTSSTLCQQLRINVLLCGVRTGGDGCLCASSHCHRAWLTYFGDCYHCQASS